MSLNISYRRFSQRLGLGILAYRLFFAPLGFLNKWSQRGMIPFLIDRWQKHQMEMAALRLAPLQTTCRSGPVYEVHFLSGERFWYQTSFCFYSLLQQTNLNLKLVVYDDGTLSQAHIEKIIKIFPTASIVTAQQIQEKLDKYLPVEKFPYLRSRRLEYPNLRKLTDIHVGASGWKLVLDSDMLFFHSPLELLSWLESPSQPCHMVDTETAYGYSNSLMMTLAGIEIPEQINVGICGLKSNLLNWDELEDWCKQMIEIEGTHYFQEQAMIAMLMARHSCSVMSAEEYIVMPKEQEVSAPTAKMHHYVADSKPWYFRYGWQQVLAYNTQNSP